MLVCARVRVVSVVQLELGVHGDVLVQMSCHLLSPLVALMSGCHCVSRRPFILW